MKAIDRRTLHRLVATVANFILGIMKIFAPKVLEDIEVPEVTPDQKRIFPIFRRKKKDEEST